MHFILQRICDFQILPVFYLNCQNIFVENYTTHLSSLFLQLYEMHVGKKQRYKSTENKLEACENPDDMSRPDNSSKLQKTHPEKW